MGLMDMLRNDGVEVVKDPVQVQKALAYIRVSHEDSADRNTSLQTQRMDIERYASREGIEVLEWFDEPGKSAFKDDGRRTEFTRMIRQAKETPGVSLILVWKSDRFCRDRYQAAAVKGELAKAGIRVLSVLEPYDSRTTSGIVLESVNDAMNQIRSMEIGLVTHRNLLTNCEMRDPETGWAYKNGGWAQFGYRNHRVYIDAHRKYQRMSHCIWILDDEIVAGKTVHEWARTMLIDWRLKEKVGPDVIAKRLTEAGVPTPSGRKAWSDSTINTLLMPERLIQYAGVGTWNKIEYRNGSKRPKDRSEWKIIENAHTAIITMEEADAIQTIRESRTCRPGKRGKRPSPYVLSGGLLTCARCGVNFAGKCMHGDDYYVCGAQIYRHGADCGRPWYIRREVLEKGAMDCIEQFYTADSAHLRKLVTEHNKWVDSEYTFQQTNEQDRQGQIDILNNEIANLTKSLAAGVDPATMRQQINWRAAQVQNLNAEANAPLPRKLTAKDVKSLVAEVRQTTESREPDRRRTIIRRYIAAMQADPERRIVRVLMHPLEASLSPLTGSARALRGNVHIRDQVQRKRKRLQDIPGRSTCHLAHYSDRVYLLSRLSRPV